jgi:hypothetical protein
MEKGRLPLSEGKDYCNQAASQRPKLVLIYQQYLFGDTCNIS